MKIDYICLIAVLALSVVVPSHGKGTPHTFTTPDGRTLEATILQYSARNGKIQIERADGKKIWTLPTVFSAPDQAYIQKWIAVDKFLSSSSFKITGDSSKDKETEYDERDGARIKSRETTAVIYMLTLQNRTGFPLGDVRIEYRAFIEQKGYEGREDSSRVAGGQIQVNKIPDGQKITESTKAIRLQTSYVTKADYDSITSSRSYYAVKTFEDDLKGFWVRVYGPTVDGETVFREWCYPSDTIEDYTWQNVSE